MLEIHLYGKLRRFTDNEDPCRDSIISIPVEQGATIGKIVEQIGISHKELGSNIFLNGQYSTLTRKVKTGDRLGIFPDDMQLLYKWYFHKNGDDEHDDQG